jgi:hypothetical protein
LELKNPQPGNVGDIVPVVTEFVCVVTTIYVKSQLVAPVDARPSNVQSTVSPPDVNWQVSAPDGDVTTKLAVGPAAVMLTVAVCDVPFNVAVITAVLELEVAAADTVKVAVEAPDATVTLPGVVTNPAGDDESATTVPPDGAA